MDPILPPPADTTSFNNNCAGRIINVSQSTGCTLTRASIQALTPAAFEAQGFTEVYMDQVYATAREARAAGYIENTLQALLMSRFTNIKGQLTKSAIGTSESVILPYISRRQRRNIQSNYFAVTAGVVNGAAGQGNVPPSAWDLTVTNNPSIFGNTLQNLEQYFLPGKILFVEYSNATTNVAYSLQYSIISAQTSSAGVTTVTVAPNVSNTGWSGYNAAQKAPFQIANPAVAGTICYLGVNSVSDYESWGGQDVAENTLGLIHFWTQTSRIVQEYTDEYLKALNASLTSNYFKQFRQMPLAQQKAIQKAKYDRDMLTSAFYGQAINENQSVETYRNLPIVVDPSNPNCTLEYKSNSLGFRTQLLNCGRVLDHQGNALNLDNLFAVAYLLKRAREATGGEVEVIDIMTDRFTAGRILDIMTTFYKGKYGANINRYYDPDQSLNFENQVELYYNKYQLPPEYGGISIAVFTHKFFDDKISAMGGANRGNVLWMLDWTDIELGIADTNSAVRQTNVLDNLFNYVMKINIKHVTMNSMKWAAIIEDPNRHYIIENFSSACPSLTVTGCTV